MSQREGLAGLRDEIATCMRCGNCQAVCPVYREVRREPAVARGKVALAEALLAGQIEPDKELARQLDLCLTCKACVDACPSGVRVDDIILAARAEIVQRRGMPWLKAAIFGAVKRPRILDAGVTMATKMQGLVMADGPEDGLGVPRLPIDSRRRPVLPKLPAEPLRTGESSAGRIPHPVGRVVFYPGCMVSYVYPAIGRALIAVLRTASVEVLVPPTAQCCGLPMLMHGDVATAQEMARATIEGLERLGGDAVLTACPTCGSALKHHMTHLLRDDADWAPRATRLAARAMDASEYLVDRLELPSAATRSAIRVTYHGPVPPGAWPGRAHSASRAHREGRRYGSRRAGHLGGVLRRRRVVSPHPFPACRRDRGTQSRRDRGDRRRDRGHELPGLSSAADRQPAQARPPAARVPHHRDTRRGLRPSRAVARGRATDHLTKETRAPLSPEGLPASPRAPTGSSLSIRRRARPTSATSARAASPSVWRSASTRRYSP